MESQKGHRGDMQDFEITVPPALVPYVEPALARLGYLFPALEWSFRQECNRIVASGDRGDVPAADLRKEVLFHLYREKVHHETLSIRNRIYEAIGT